MNRSETTVTLSAGIGGFPLTAKEPVPCRSISLVCLMLILLLLPWPVHGQLHGREAQQVGPREPRCVLVLYSYNYSQPAQKLIAAGLESARKIADLSPDEYVHEYLDISPPKDAEQRRLLRELLLWKYAGKRFDLIITVFDNALDFLMREGEELSPGSPCLALYNQERPNLERGGLKVVQSPLHFDVLGTLKLALRLLPETRKVLFVSGMSNLDQAFEKKARADFAPWQGKLAFEYTSDRSVAEVLEQVRHLPAGTVVIYGLVSSDITGRTYSPYGVAAMLAKSANTPVFALATSQLETGVVGGSMLDVESLSAMLGRALSVLGEQEPFSIKPASEFVRPMVNWQQILRWNISESRLPVDCLVINRPLTLWNQYRKTVITAGLVFFVLLLLAGALAIQNRRRARAEKAARLSEARYRVLIDHAPDAIVVYDGDLKRFVDANPKAEALFGCSGKELRQADPFRFYPPEQRDERAAAESMYKALSRALGGETIQFERTILNTEGDRILCEVRLVRLPSEKGPLFRASYIDITERKRAEEALRQSEERYRSILWIAMDGFWLFDHRGHFLEVNEAYCQMSGYSADELRTMCISDVEALEAREDIAARIKTTMDRGRIRFESRHRHKDGHLFDVEISVTYRDMDGGQFASFIRDITERKKAEEEREKLQAQLNQAQKMESVGRLAGGVAHDFNNMLGVILGYLDIIMAKEDLHRPLLLKLKEIRLAAERSAALTRQLLAFARKQITSPKVLDLNMTVDGMLRMLRRLLGEDIDLVWLPGAGVEPVLMDPSQVDQILANLCVNARDAINGVGKISIETANATFDAEYCARYLDCVPGNYVLLSVSDNGCGMDKETRERIFEPFFTTKELGRGTGLGLSTVYGIVKQNEGFINVYSDPGKGSTFKVYLPRYAGLDEPVEQQGSASMQTGGHETILVAEDDPAILKMTAIMLEEQGYTVLMASTPGEAIEVAENHGKEIHLLISDVIMPKMSGLDLAKKLMHVNPRMRYLFMSGYTADVIAHHGVLNKKVRFIHKPFSKRDLAAKVREALDDSSGRGVAWDALDQSE